MINLMKYRIDYKILNQIKIIMKIRIISFRILIKIIKMKEWKHTKKKMEKWEKTNKKMKNTKKKKKKAKKKMKKWKNTMKKVKKKKKNV